MAKSNINYAYVWGVAFTSAIGFWQLGYCFAYFNFFEKILHKRLAQEGNEVIESESLFNSIMSGLIPGGAIFGSILVGFIVGYGRRLSLIIISATFCIGAGITLILHFYSIFIGRLIMG